MNRLTIVCGAVALALAAATPATAYTFDYSAFGGAPASITGDFSLVGSTDVIGTLSGSVDGAMITAFQSGTYDGDHFTANFLTATGAYNLNGENGFISVVTSGGNFVSLGSLDVTGVPLPWSAPMFGAALATLGLFGRRLAAATREPNAGVSSTPG